VTLDLGVLSLSPTLGVGKGRKGGEGREKKGS